MTTKPNMILIVFAMVIFLSLVSCDDASTTKEQASSKIESKKISVPAVPKKSTEQKIGLKPAEKSPDDKLTAKNPSEKKDTDAVAKKDIIGKEEKIALIEQTLSEPDDEHYRSKGKIDPFKPLIQEKSDASAPVVDNRPKRILTPLEKIELSQIKLVAIISMKNRKIAMVEEANGKGYEVGVGTYMGKKQGRVFKITDSSILVKEVIRDFKGQLKERVEEIKIHKNDSEE